MLNKILLKYPKLNQYKPGLDFLARLFFIGVIIIIIKYFYFFFADKDGIIHSSLLGSFSPIEAVRITLLKICRIVLLIFNESASIHGWGLKVPGAMVLLNTPCLGINVCLAFIALVLAYPLNLPFLKKLTYIIIGITIIQTLNVFRIIGVLIALREGIDIGIDQHDLFNFIIYIVIFLLFINYTNLKGPTSVNN